MFIRSADPELSVSEPDSIVSPISVSDPDTFNDPVIVTFWLSGLTYDAVKAFSARLAVPKNQLVDGIVIPVVSI